MVEYITQFGSALLRLRVHKPPSNLVAGSGRDKSGVSLSQVFLSPAQFVPVALPEVYAPCSGIAQAAHSGNSAMGAKVVACSHAALLLRILPCSNRKHPLPGRGQSTDLRIGRYRNGVAGRGFSAIQTAWRRGRDSNPRYSFLTAPKRPRVRELHGIPHHERASRRIGEGGPVQQ